jgi:hypothetical protein
MARGGSEVVAQLTHDPNIKGSNAPTAGNGEKIAQKVSCAWLKVVAKWKRN